MKPKKPINKPKVRLPHKPTKDHGDKTKYERARSKSELKRLATLDGEDVNEILQKYWRPM